MSKTELPVDWDHFHVLLEGILHRVPSMGNAVLERLTNGPEPFSADGNWILGHAPEVESIQAFLYVSIIVFRSRYTLPISNKFFLFYRYEITLWHQECGQLE